MTNKIMTRTGNRVRFVGVWPFGEIKREKESRACVADDRKP